MRTDIAIVYHLGAPNTDNDQLFRSLRKDAVMMRDSGFLLQRPKNYRRLLTETIEKNSKQEASLPEQELLLSTLTNQQDVARLFLSNSTFLGVPSWMFNKSVFYQNAALRTNELRNIFPGNPCEFFLAIRNPATFIPEAFLSQDTKDYDNFIGGMDLGAVRWSDVIDRIQQANPDCPLTVWCNEDTPIIWSTVLSEVAALDPQTRLSGDLDVIQPIISNDGFLRLKQYLDERPKLNEMQRRRVKGVFLEKFVIDDAIEQEIDLPGWTGKRIEAMTEVYEDDIERIQRMPGVNFISP